jgi:hypothetical protein
MFLNFSGNTLESIGIHWNPFWSDLLRFQHAWKDQTADSTVELHVVEPYVEDYPGQPSLHAILVKNPEAMKQVPVLVEVKDEKSQQQKWKVRKGQEILEIR